MDTSSSSSFSSSMVCVSWLGLSLLLVVVACCCLSLSLVVGVAACCCFLLLLLVVACRALWGLRDVRRLMIQSVSLSTDGTRRVLVPVEKRTYGWRSWKSAHDG